MPHRVGRPDLDPVRTVGGVKVVLALAVLGGLGWFGYQRVAETHPKAPAPVQVNVNVPQPFGGSAPAGDKIYVP